MKHKKMLFFVYGTLKRGKYNNFHLGKAEFKGTFTTPAKYTLFDGGFPVVERGGETAIQGELFYSENEKDIENVFELEGCSSQIKGDKENWYDFDLLDTPLGVAVIFVMDKSKSNRYKILKDGIWN